MPTLTSWLPEAASAHAAELDGVLVAIHWHVLVLALAWGALFVFVLVRFRAGRHPVPSPVGAGTLLPALAIAAVIAGDVAILATNALPAWLRRVAEPPGLALIEAGAGDALNAGSALNAGPALSEAGSRQAPGRVEGPLEVRVFAEQFAWNIHYPGPDGEFGRTSTNLISAANPLGIDRTDGAARDDIGVLNVLTLPLGRTVVVHLSSRDVVHSFTLNEMRVKQDAVPGMVTRTWFTPIRTGKWDIACSQLCGLGHYRMRGDYTVVTPEEWRAWEQEEQSFIFLEDAPR